MWTNRVIPFVTGMDANIADNHRPDPVLYRLINARPTKQGEIAKRQGFAHLSRVVYDELTASRELIDLDGLGNRLAAKSLIVNTNRKNGETADSLCLLSEGPLFKYSASGWRPKDIYTTSATEGNFRASGIGCGIESQRVLRDVGDHDATTVAVSSTYSLTAWIENASTAETDPRLYYALYDIVNGDYLVGGKLVSSSDVLYCMAVCSGTYLKLFYIEGANLKVIDFDTTPLAPVTTTLKTNVVNIAAASGTALPFYVAPGHGSGSDFVYSYKNTAGDIIVSTLSGANVETGTHSYTPAAAAHAVAVEYDSVSNKYVLAVAVATPNIVTRVLSTALVDQAIDVSIVPRNTVVRITIGFDPYYYGATAGTKHDVRIIWEDVNAAYRSVETYGRRTTDNSTTDTPRRSYYNATLLSTAFRQGGITYVTLGYGAKVAKGTTAQGTVFVVDVGQKNADGANIAGRWGHNKAAGEMDSRRFDRKGPPSRATFCSVTNKWYIGQRAKTRFVQQNGTSVDFAKSVTLSFDFTIGASYVNINNMTYFSNGSVLKQFDGDKVVEAGFLLYPEMIISDATIAAGGALSAGSYSWRFYYESMVGGRRVRSFASELTATVVLNNKVTFLVPTLPMTQRGANEVYIVGYRTEVNPTSSSPFYRITALAPSASGGLGWFVNDFSAATVSIADTLSDANLLNEIDYQSTGEVAHIIPEIKYIAKHGNRLVGCDSYNIHPSLLFSELNAVEFSDDISQEITDVDGPLTGLASLGNNLALFKKNKILIMTGEGPDNTGLGAYSDLYETTQLVGAKNQSCVEKIPSGVVFASDNGVFVINESFQPVFIGKPIHDVVKSLGHSYLKIVYNPTDKAIYILVGATDFSVTNIFVYFTEEQMWSIWDLSNNFDVYDIAIVNGFVAALTKWCTVSIQTASTWSDTYQNSASDTETTTYPFTIITDFINIVEKNPASYSRAKSVKLVSTKGEVGAGTVSVSCAYDNDTGYTWTNIDPGLLTGENTFVNDGDWRFEHHLTKQRCSNIRIRINYDWLTEGYRFTHLILRTKPSENSSKDSPNETT